MLEIKDLIDMSLTELSGHAHPKAEADSVKIEYSLNKHGYRCNEFSEQEVLFLGCSQTEGHGLPVELTWPYLLSQKMNKDYACLAKGGDGAQSQVVKAFQFFKEFHHPKYIFASFPMARLDVPLIDVKVRNLFNRKIGKAIFDNRLVEKFSKFPHNIEKVLTEEFAVYYNILFIKMLSQYCDANNIKFIWFDHRDTTIQLPTFEKIGKGYIDFKSFKIDYEYEEKECHVELSDNKFFHHAADYDYWPPGHWGFHKQLHIAEYLYSIIDKDTPLQL